MRPDTITVQPPLFPSVPRRRREVRDPYDGLRPWSAITHGAGAVLSLAGTIYLLLRTAAEGNGLVFGLMAVYGLSMVCLYTASTLYHCLRVSVPGRLALRKYDHCSIYLLIAGSYTPICMTLSSGAAWAPPCCWPSGCVRRRGSSSPSPSWTSPAGSPASFTWPWLDGSVRHRPSLPRPARRGHVLADRRRSALHRGRGALRGQVARPEQPPLWLPRDLPRLYRPGQRVSLYPDVFRGRSPVTLPETPDPPGHGMAGSFFSFAPGG